MGLYEPTNFSESGFEINQKAVESYFQAKEKEYMESDPVEKDVNKVIENELWLSNEFPLQFSQFMEVLDTLSLSGNANMKKMQEFLHHSCLQEVISKNGFPVKIQIPIGVIIKATVTFGKFQFLKGLSASNRHEIFEIPSSFKLVKRREGMKTLESKKKRMAVANVIS